MLAQGGNTPQALGSWIAIGADGNVTVYTGRADMGQGTYTVQYQLAAEELSVPISRIRLVECDTAMTPDQGTSSGSQAHPVNFNHENLAQACATAREALVAMAATKLGAPIDQLTAANGVISLKSDASKKATYGELIGGKRFNLNLQPNAKRKPQKDRTGPGTSVPRGDITGPVPRRLGFPPNRAGPCRGGGRGGPPPAAGAA